MVYFTDYVWLYRLGLMYVDYNWLYTIFSDYMVTDTIIWLETL
jgi:hypothetical protein